MVRFSMVRLSLVILLLTAAIPAQGEDPKTTRQGSRVPFLADIPTLGTLFKHPSESLWYPLGDAPPRATSPVLGTGKATEPDELPFRERWLRRELKATFKDLRAVDVVQQQVERWNDAGRTLSGKRGLELSGPEATLKKARAWLDSVMAQGKDIVVADVSFVRGLDLRTDGNAGPKVVMLSASRFAGLERRIQKQKGAELITSPRLSVYNGQRASVSITNQVAYVKDFEVEVVKGASIADPVIDVVNDGFVMDITPMTSPDRPGVALDARITVATLKRPIDEVTTTLSGVGSPVTIQLPTVSLSRWHSDELEIGGDHVGFLVTGLAAPSADWKKVEPVDVLVRVSVVKVDELASPTAVVIAVDDDAGHVVARWSRALKGAKNLEGSTVDVWRGDTKIARARVSEVHGRLFVLQPLEGKVKAGDRIK